MKNSYNPNDENLCPNIGSTRGKTNIAVTSPRSGPSIAKMVAFFNSTVETNGVVMRSHTDGAKRKLRGSAPGLSLSIGPSDIDRNKSRWRSNAPKITSGVHDELEKETRRKLMLQQRRLQRVTPHRSEIEKSSPVLIDSDAEVSVSEIREPINIYIAGSITKAPTDNVTVHSYDVETSQKANTNVLTMLYQTMLFALALYEIQFYCADISRYLSDISGWSSGNILLLRLLLELRRAVKYTGFGAGMQPSLNDCLHVMYVLAFLLNGLVPCFVYARRCSVQGSKGIQRFKRVLLFLSTATCWTMILPVFYAEPNYVGSNFFVQEVSKRKGGVVDMTFIVSRPRYSCLDVIFMRIYRALTLQVKSLIKGRLFREFQHAFTNPFKFHGRIKSLFRFIRWAKFLAPLIGTCNKLRGHILDMIKKKRQRLTARNARKMWTEAIRALSLQHKSERAVMQLQKVFREKRERKANRRIELMSPIRPGAQRIRKRLREECNTSKSKLIKMEISEHQRQLRRQVSKDEWQCMAEHKQSVKKEKRKLLLSPKTTFAVGWKCVAISCVVLEVSQLVFAPMLSGELKKMPLDKFVSVILFASCDEKKKDKRRRFLIPAMNKVDDFCHTSTWMHVWLMAAQIITSVLVPLVNSIFFLDVFITFSTGELTPAGQLVPKPFFARYILPGIGLQLLVNPTMVAISRLVRQGILECCHIGPSLCLHLIAASFPMINFCFNRALDKLLDFVEMRNKVLTQCSVFE